MIAKLVEQSQSHITSDLRALLHDRFIAAGAVALAISALDTHGGAVASALDAAEYISAIATLLYVDLNGSRPDCRENGERRTLPIDEPSRVAVMWAAATALRVHLLNRCHFTPVARRVTHTCLSVIFVCLEDEKITRRGDVQGRCVNVRWQRRFRSLVENVSAPLLRYRSLEK